MANKTKRGADESESKSSMLGKTSKWSAKDAKQAAIHKKYEKALAPSGALNTSRSSKISTRPSTNDKSKRDWRCATPGERLENVMHDLKLRLQRGEGSQKMGLSDKELMSNRDGAAEAPSRQRTKAQEDLSEAAKHVVNDVSMTHQSCELEVVPMPQQHQDDQLARVPQNKSQAERNVKAVGSATAEQQVELEIEVNNNSNKTQFDADYEALKAAMETDEQEATEAANSLEAMDEDEVPDELNEAHPGLKQIVAPKQPDHWTLPGVTGPPHAVEYKFRKYLEQNNPTFRSSGCVFFDIEKKARSQFPEWPFEVYVPPHLCQDFAILMGLRRAPYTEADESRIVLVTSMGQQIQLIEEELPTLALYSFVLVDTEGKPPQAVAVGFPSGTRLLLQLKPIAKSIGLSLTSDDARVADLNSLLCPKLKQLLADPEVLVVGSDLRKDLHTDFNDLTIRGALDLQEVFAQRVSKYYGESIGFGMATIAVWVFGLPYHHKSIPGGLVFPHNRWDGRLKKKQSAYLSGDIAAGVGLMAKLIMAYAHSDFGAYQCRSYPQIKGKELWLQFKKALLSQLCEGTLMDHVHARDLAAPSIQPRLVNHAVVSKPVEQVTPHQSARHRQLEERVEQHSDMREYLQSRGEVENEAASQPLIVRNDECPSRKRSLFNPPSEQLCKRRSLLGPPPSDLSLALTNHACPPGQSGTRRSIQTLGSMHLRQAPPPWTPRDSAQSLLPMPWKDDPLEGFCLVCGTVHGGQCSWQPDPCKYEGCSDPRPHALEFCPTLHSRCGKCRLRGHRSDQCSDELRLREARQRFLSMADLGHLTKQRRDHPGYGLWPLFTELTAYEIMAEAKWRFLEEKASWKEAKALVGRLGFNHEKELKKVFYESIAERPELRSGPGLANLDPYHQCGWRASLRQDRALRRLAETKGLDVHLSQDFHANQKRSFDQNKMRKKRQAEVRRDAVQALKPRGGLRPNVYYVKKGPHWRPIAESDALALPLPTVRRLHNGRIQVWVEGIAANSAASTSTAPRE